MADKILNIKVCSPLKLRSGLAGKYHAVCHYSYNFPLAFFTVILQQFLECLTKDMTYKTIRKICGMFH
jgi:hypothetical protein